MQTHYSDKHRGTRFNAETCLVQILFHGSHRTYFGVECEDPLQLQKQQDAAASSSPASYERMTDAAERSLVELDREEKAQLGSVLEDLGAFQYKMRWDLVLQKLEINTPGNNNTAAAMRLCSLPTPTEDLRLTKLLPVVSAYLAVTQNSIMSMNFTILKEIGPSDNDMGYVKVAEIF